MDGLEFVKHAKEEHLLFWSHEVQVSNCALSRAKVGKLTAQSAERVP